MNILMSCFFESQERVSEEDFNETKKKFDTMLKGIKVGATLLETHEFSKIAMAFAFERQGVKP